MHGLFLLNRGWMVLGVVEVEDMVCGASLHKGSDMVVRGCACLVRAVGVAMRVFKVGRLGVSM